MISFEHSIWLVIGGIFILPMVIYQCVKWAMYAYFKTKRQFERKEEQ